MRRRGRIESGGAGAEAELLQAGGVELTAGIQVVFGLKLLESGDGVAVPLAVGIALVVARAGERGLNFGDALVGGGLLERFTARTVVRGGLFLVVRGGLG